MLVFPSAILFPLFGPIPGLLLSVGRVWGVHFVGFAVVYVIYVLLCLHSSRMSGDGQLAFLLLVPLGWIIWIWVNASPMLLGRRC